MRQIFMELFFGNGLITIVSVYVVLGLLGTAISSLKRKRRLPKDSKCKKIWLGCTIFTMVMLLLLVIFMDISILPKFAIKIVKMAQCLIVFLWFYYLLKTCARVWKEPEISITEINF